MSRQDFLDSGIRNVCAILLVKKIAEHYDYLKGSGPMNCTVKLSIKETHETLKRAILTKIKKIFFLEYDRSKFKLDNSVTVKHYLTTRP